MRFKTILTSALALAAAVTLAAPASQAEDAAGFYKGKTVRIVVGYGPGGGYDTYARMIAPHLGKVLGATVIVENQPGAGGVTALNRIYMAQPDGLQLMIVNGTAAALGQLVDQSGVRYDLSKIEHLGIVSSSPWMWLVNSAHPIAKTPTEAMKLNKLIRWGGTSLTDGLSDGASVASEALKLKCKVVIGYKGSSAVALALQRGEIDSEYVSDTSANNYVHSGQAIAIAAMGRAKSRFFPNVPTIFEAVKLNKDQQQWFDFRANLDDLGRILVTTPKVPADRLAFLREAVKTVLTDPKVKAEGEKRQRYIDFVSPDKAREKAVSLVSGMSPERKKVVKHLILEKYH
jgi:tripartite-type tricarboxylate transporter receptor subunit TctC